MLLTTPPGTPKTTPLVSVIVPVHDTDEYVRYSVDSILRQSYAQLDIILIDDGSTDASAAILDEYTLRDDRVTVIHQTHAGAAKARNAGLDVARGAYVTFVNSDDILDRRYVELLLHAALRTGADLAKARWRQFGVARLYDVAEAAAEGEREPEHVTVFTDALQAYQNVFCKSLRLVGTEFGRNTEARYFNDSCWGRLYRSTLWEGLRFPEDTSAHVAMAAGELYPRVGKVADIDVVLYHQLQHEGDEPPEHEFAYQHDLAEAAARNFDIAMAHGVLPARSYYALASACDAEPSTRDFDEPGMDSSVREAHQAAYQNDLLTLSRLTGRLTPTQRLRCTTTQLIRRFEHRMYWLRADLLKRDRKPWSSADMHIEDGNADGGAGAPDAPATDRREPDAPGITTPDAPGAPDASPTPRS